MAYQDEDRAESKTDQCKETRLSLTDQQINLDEIFKVSRIMSQLQAGGSPFSINANRRPVNDLEYYPLHYHLQNSIRNKAIRRLIAGAVWFTKHKFTAQDMQLILGPGVSMNSDAGHSQEKGIRKEAKACHAHVIKFLRMGLFRAEQRSPEWRALPVGEQVRMLKTCFEASPYHHALSMYHPITTTVFITATYDPETRDQNGKILAYQRYILGVFETMLRKTMKTIGAWRSESKPPSCRVSEGGSGPYLCLLK